MRWSAAHIPTLRDAPQEAEIISHKLMLRAGLIRRLASGIYSFLPMGWKAVLKFQNIVREEMNRAGAQEVSLPIVQPKELWEEAGRWQVYGKELGRFTDRHEHDFCLQPTSEEAITDLVRRDVKSYRQLPINLYQIQTKFRDEVRPRFGIMRGREFVMKDAYSFDLTPEGAFKSYEAMRAAYRRIFERAGLRFIPVDADTGAIGGTKSEEFTVLADSGEDEIVACTKCEYGANQEKAVGVISDKPAAAKTGGAYEKFATPGLKTIAQLAESQKCKEGDLAKTMIATDTEGHCIVVVLRGDHELHELKLQTHLSQKMKWKGVRLATDVEIQNWKLPKGSLGPAEFPVAGATVVVDDALSLEAPYIVGANEEGFHFRNVVFSRDAKVNHVGTIRRVQAGERCPKCGNALEIKRGIEVGHVFYLGKKYSEAMKAEVLGEDGKLQSIEMGCYGIGVTRTIAASIEQNHDEWGIIWPLALAPYELSIISLGEGEPQKKAEEIYKTCLDAGIDVIWDDRSLSPGVKLKDSDLVGIPYQLIIGEKGLKNSQVEWKERRGSKKDLWPVAEAGTRVVSEIQSRRRENRIPS